MKIERKITLEERELSALRTIAGVKCSEISCHDCPFKIYNVDSKPCLVNITRMMLVLHDITW